MKYPSVKLALSGGLVILAVLVLLLIGSCGKGKSTSTLLAPQESVRGSPSVETEGRKLPSLEEVLANLDALEKPAEADRRVWMAIKGDLREWLLENYQNARGVRKYDPDPPEGARPYPPTHDYVKPRDLKWSHSGTYGKLVWTYVNDGDYNQDGTVNVSDITPLAAYYDQHVYQDNTIQELIDEDDEPNYGFVDGDDLVDGPENQLYDYNDAWTLYKNFYVDVAKYEVWGSDDEEEWQLVGEVEFTDEEEPNCRIHYQGWRDTFEYQLENSDYTFYKVRALSEIPDTRFPEGDPRRYAWQTGPDEDDPIIESDVWEMKAPEVTRVRQYPKPATVGFSVKFTAYLSSDSPGPFQYQWDFAGLTDPNNPTGNPVSVTLTSPPQPEDVCRVTVTSPYGQDTYEFHIGVEQSPPEILEVYTLEGDPPTKVPPRGDPGQEITIYAEIDGSRPIDPYVWNFGDAATPSQVEGTIEAADAEQRAVATVTLTMTPGVYDCYIDAHNAFGDAPTFHFELTVGQPPEIGDITPTQGMSGEDVQFVAEVTGSPPLTYEWDFGDIGKPDTSSDESPIVTLGYGGTVLYPERVRTVSLTVTSDVGLGSTHKEIQFTVNGQWHIEPVQEGSQEYAYTSLEFFPDGTPSIAYRHGSSGVCYAERNGTAEDPWADTHLVDNCAGEYVSHEIDHLGIVHMCYYDSTNGNLKYAVGRGDTWDVQIVDGDEYTDAGEYCDIALNSAGLPGISYFKASPRNLWYVYFDGEDWSTPEHVEPDPSEESGYSGEYTSIKYDSNDVPHISYSGDIRFNPPPITRNLKFAWRDAQWLFCAPDTAGLGGYYSSLELTTATDDAVIAYQRVDPTTGIGSLWLVEQLSGFFWQAPVLLLEGSGQPGAGEYASLELDPQGREAVSYADQTSIGGDIATSDLKFTIYDELRDELGEDPWVTLTVDDEGPYLVGFYTSLAFDPTVTFTTNSYPAISYVKRQAATTMSWLMFARWW